MSSIVFHRIYLHAWSYITLSLFDRLGDATRLRKEKELEMERRRQEAERLAAEKAAKEMAAIDAEEAQRKVDKQRMLQEGIESAKSKLEQAAKAKEMREQSAVKIQSAFRGKNARRKVKQNRKKRKEELEEKEHFERVAAQERLHKEQEAKATHIQALWRGKFARKCVFSCSFCIFFSQTLSYSAVLLPLAVFVCS